MVFVECQRYSSTSHLFLTSQLGVFRNKEIAGTGYRTRTRLVTCVRPLVWNNHSYGDTPSSQKYFVLLEFQPDWIEIVDFLLIAKFLDNYDSPSTYYILLFIIYQAMQHGGDSFHLRSWQWAIIFGSSQFLPTN